jgi:hypothetical protein
VESEPAKLKGGMRLDRNVQRIQHSSFLVGGRAFQRKLVGLT